MHRSEVYQLIDSERAYQDETWGDPDTTEGRRTAAEFALFVHSYTHRLAEICSDPRVGTAQGEDAQDFFRKVAALCVAAMEQHGGRERLTVATKTNMMRDLRQATGFSVETIRRACTAANWHYGAALSILTKRG